MVVACHSPDLHSYDTRAGIVVGELAVAVDEIIAVVAADPAIERHSNVDGRPCRCLRGEDESGGAQPRRRERGDHARRREQECRVLLQIAN